MEPFKEEDRRDLEAAHALLDRVAQRMSGCPKNKSVLALRGWALAVRDLALRVRVQEAMGNSPKPKAG